MDTLQSRILRLPMGRTLMEISMINSALKAHISSRIVPSNPIFKKKVFNPCLDKNQLQYLLKWLNLNVVDILSYSSGSVFNYDARLVHCGHPPVHASWIVSTPKTGGFLPLWNPNRAIFQGGLAASEDIAVVKAVYSAIVQVGIDRLLN